MFKVGFMVSETTMTTQRCLTLWFASVPLMRNRTISHSVHSLYSLHISLISICFSTAHSLPPSPFSRFPSHCFLLPCLPSSLLAFLLPLHHSSWLEVQLRRYNWRASLLLSSLSPSDDGISASSILPQPPLAACVPSMLLAVSVR